MYARGVLVVVLALVCLGLLPPPAQSLTVHMVPHTHDDVGWLKTVDQYFTGSNSSLQHAAVSNLITAVIAALVRVPARRFVYVEQAFFQRWWRQQESSVRATVRRLVAGGQLSFINGGWCMHDEATTHYVDMLDQTTLGHQYILEQFGAAANPTIGWQVDPFGHSATQPTLLGHEVGFDALFFGRIDYQDHDQRVARKDMQFSWAPSPSLGPTSQVWTEVALDGNYNPPGGLCWDYLCSDPEVQDRRDLEDVNVDSRVDDFVRAAMSYARTRKGDLDTMNVQFNMGTDFNYESAEKYFINMDRIIAAVNRNGTIKAQYSTPAIYYKARLQENITWSTKTDDFFPYADGPGSQWTGYFTSRPGVKGYVRSSSIALQIARQLEVFTGGDGTGTEAAWEAVAVAQHHDAVSGTERQHVSYDYTQRIAKGMATAYRTLDASLSRLAANGSTLVDYRSCPLLNISVCPAMRESSTAGYTVILYNPRARPSTDLISLPYFASTEPIVTDSTGALIPSDVVPVPRTSALTADSAPQHVQFKTPRGLPGLGFDTFTIRPSSTPRSARVHAMGSGARAVRMERPSAETVSIDSSGVRLTFDNGTGLLTSWTDKASGTVHSLSQDFYYYQSSEDDTYGTTNAYTFQPKNGTGLFPISRGPVELSVFQGQLSSMVHQRWNAWLSQTWRLSDGMMPEVQWTVGSIDISDGVSKEVVTRYSSDIASAGELWTDANGREFQRRLRNRRPSFNFTLVSPIASNYYPVTTAVKLNDSQTGFVVLVDRAEGAASLQDGAIELMVHRRFLCGCGFDEPLNETDAAVYNDRGDLTHRIGPGLIVTGRHRLFLGDPADVLVASRVEAWKMYTPHHAVVAAGVSDRSAAGLGRLSFLRSALPEAVELMTLQVLFDGSVLLRLAHSFAVDDASPLAAPVDVDVSALFVQPITSIKQRTLTANADYKTRVRDRLPFRTTREVSEEEWARAKEMHRGLRDTTITLYPMQIVSFAIAF